MRSMRMDPPTRARAPAAALVRGGATQKTRDQNDRARARQTSSHSTPRKTYIRRTASRSELPLFDVQSAGCASRQDGRVATPRICENSTAAVLLLQLDRTDRRRPRAERWALLARQLGAVLCVVQLHEGRHATSGICRARAPSRPAARRAFSFSVDALIDETGIMEGKGGDNEAVNRGDGVMRTTSYGCTQSQ